MNKYLVGGLALLSSSMSFAEGSPWLPEPGATNLNLSYVKQSADEVFKGFKKDNLDKLKQDTYSLQITHGYSEDLAFDATIGYAQSDFSNPANSSDSGITDTNLGVTWRFNDEFISDSALPSAALRVGVTIAGDYEAGIEGPYAIGDGADSLDASLVLGKSINEWLAVSGEIGYRFRSDNTPDEAIYKVGAYVTPEQGFTVGLNYSIVNADDGLDIGGDGFKPTLFAETEEDIELVSLGVSYNINEKMDVALSYGKVIDGRNTAKSDIIGLSLSYSF